MKPINETRINNLINYIKDYCDAHGIAPTYREMKENLGYTSLSLVSADIKKLKDRGVLIDDDFSHIRLTSNKDQHIRKYNYPFLLMTDASKNIGLLNEEEKALLEAQNLYLQGNYKEAQNIAKNLLKTTKEESVMFGAKLTLTWSSFYTGEVNYWKEFSRLLITYQPKTLSEKMEKELVAHFLISLLGNKDNCPKWLDEGRFYDLRKEAYPLASLLFVARAINSDKLTSPHYLEPLCSIANLNGIDAVQVYMDLYLALSYHYTGHDEYLDSHINAAIETCLRNRWLTPLAEVRKSLGNIMYPILEEKEEGITKKIDALIAELSAGYNKVYEALVGENPVKDLTFREVEIMNYVHMNFSNKEIADKMYLSPETVKYYLSSIYLKLGVNGRKELRDLIKRYTVIG